jgi:hypothetical protein
MSTDFQRDLREARQAGAFHGTVYCTCENPRCAVDEVEITVKENPRALPFQ